MKISIIFSLVVSSILSAANCPCPSHAQNQKCCESKQIESCCASSGESQDSCCEQRKDDSGCKCVHFESDSDKRTVSYDSDLAFEDPQTESNTICVSPVIGIKVNFIPIHTFYNLIL
jgi:hypothetical protein